MANEVSYYDYLKLLAPKVTNELVITCLGGTAREWHDLKHRDGNLYHTYMSGTSPMALGLALALPNRRVISLDTDGSILMGLTALPTIALQNPSNLIIIVCDNERYEAVDKMPTLTASVADLAGIARKAGIKNVTEVKELPEFQKAIDDAFQANGVSFIVAKVKLSHPSILHYTLHAVENKYRFVRYIEETENRRIFTQPMVKV